MAVGCLRIVLITVLDLTVFCVGGAAPCNIGHTALFSNSRDGNCSV